MILLAAALAWTAGSWAALAPAPPAPLRRSSRLDFRIEMGRKPYLLRIGQDDLRRLSDAVALGEAVPVVETALVVREDLFPPRVERRVPPELARRASALWRWVLERGWGESGGVEWDPELGHPQREVNDRGDILRDAVGPVPGSRAGVWSVPAEGLARESPRYAVRCLQSLQGPQRCFRVWRIAPPRRDRRRPRA